jgi:Na+-driven multidrug efflux pump
MTKDMTSGAITPLLIKFTIPLVLGNLFQLTYNAVSSWASLWARMHWLPWAPRTP